MTDLDDALVPAAFDLVEQFGTNFTFTIVTDQGTFVAATNSITGKVEQSFTRKSSPPSAFKQRYVDGKTIKESDLKIVIAAKGIALEPKLNMKVVHDATGIQYKGLVINPLYSGDLIAAWIVRLRR